jgi:protein-S-isoprenylcysteine O-methyltransferase Ste14
MNYGTINISNIRQIVLGLRPPRIALALVASGAVIDLAAPVQVVPSLPAAGALLGLLGFAIMLRAWWLFRVVETPICPTSTAAILITHDVYAVTRNPMYLGMLLMLLALALFTGNAGLFTAAVMYFVILNFFFCPFEEQRLRSTFTDYASYESTVRRWI